MPPGFRQRRSRSAEQRRGRDNLCCWGRHEPRQPEEWSMKRTLVAAVAVLALGTSTPTFAEGVGVQVGPVGAGISFAPEQRTRIKEYVVKERVAPVTVKERISVGATLPADVKLRSVPSDWGPS